MRGTLEYPSLDIGQNFYDQFPFREVLNPFAKNNGLDIRTLRKSLSLAVQAHGDLEYYVVTLEVPELTLALVNGTPELREALTRVGRGAPRYSEALRKVAPQLELYPDWNRYIMEELDSDTYYLTGMYNRKKPDPLTAELYDGWLERRTRRGESKDPFLEVLAETFPQLAR